MNEELSAPEVFELVLQKIEDKNLQNLFIEKIAEVKEVSWSEGYEAAVEQIE